MGFSSRITRTIRWLAAGCLLVSCDGPPTAPTTPAEHAPVSRPGSPGGALPYPSEIPADMRAWFLERGVQIPAKPPPAPAAKVAKAAQDERLLGDGDSNGFVGFWDLWWLWNYLTEGYSLSSLDLDLLDIDRDGDADWIDLGLLGNHLYAIPTPANAYGIGEPLAPDLVISLSPDPTTVNFVADGLIWHRFTLSVRTASGAVSDAKVKAIANPTTVSELTLEIATGARGPSSSYCGAERDDTKRNLGHGDIIWLAGCQAGLGSLVIEDAEGNWALENIYVVRVNEPRTSSSNFTIELVFVGTGFNSTQRSMVRDAADQWETVITGDIRDQQDAQFDSRDHDADGWWSNWKGRLLGGHLATRDYIDDIRVYVAAHRDDVSQAAGVGGAFWLRGGINFPILGFIGIHQDDILADPSSQDVIYSLALHEIGHALGFSNLWDESEIDMLKMSSRRSSNADTHFDGANAIAAFNAAGGWNYRGNKVPVENGGDDGHWRESVFGNELMSPVLPYGRSHEPMSEITIQSLADIGYLVDGTQAEPYTLPPAGKPAAVRAEGFYCGGSRGEPPGVAP